MRSPIKEFLRVGKAPQSRFVNRDLFSAARYGRGIVLRSVNLAGNRTVISQYGGADHGVIRRRQRLLVQDGILHAVIPWAQSYRQDNAIPHCEMPHRGAERFPGHLPQCDTGPVLANGVQKALRQNPLLYRQA